MKPRRVALHGWAGPALVIPGGRYRLSNATFTADAGEQVVVVRGGVVTLKRCRVEGGINRGIVVDGGELALEECVIAGNRVGVWATGGGKVTLRGCRVEGPGSAGLFFQQGARGIVEGGSVAGFRDSNAVVRSGASLSLQGCSLEAAGPEGAGDLADQPPQIGVWVGEGASLEMRGCRVEGFGSTGLFCEGGGGAIEGCCFTGNTVGVLVQEAADPVIVGCTIEGGASMGLYALAGARGRIVDCVVGAHPHGRVVLAEGALTAVEG